MRSKSFQIYKFCCIQTFQGLQNQIILRNHAIF